MKRILTGLILGSAWLLLLLFGPFQLFWLLVTAAAGLGLDEYFRMTLVGPERKFRAWFVAIGLFPMLASYAGRIDAVAAGFFISLLVLIAFILLNYRRISAGFDILARAGFGIIFVGFCAAHIVLLRNLSHGIEWLLVLTCITVASDTGAYYVGSWLGRAKLCPAISPGKTVAGAVGGLLSGVAAGLGAAVYLFPAVDLLKITGLAFILVWTGIAGDLTESVIKRACGVKDSGRLLAGHGGMLDRIDSLLLATPVLFYVIHFDLVAVI